LLHSFPAPAAQAADWGGTHAAGHCHQTVTVKTRDRTIATGTQSPKQTHIGFRGYSLKNQ
jgi:hypothetical protein